MDFPGIFEQHVLARLEASFGKAVAMLIAMSASNAAKTSLSSIDREAYIRMCDAICSDQRVVDMWGASGTNDALQSWKAEIGS